MGKSSDGKPLTLTNVPRDIVEKILKHCDYRAIASLRKTNKSLREFLDKSNWQCFVSCIHVQQREDHAVLKLRLGESTEVISIEYRSPEGSQTHYEDEIWQYYEKMQQITHFMNSFSYDFGLLLEHTKTSVLDEFCLEFDNVDLVLSTSWQDASLVAFWDRVQAMLTGVKPIKTRSLHMTFAMMNQVVSFLPLFDAADLKKLKLTPMRQQDVRGPNFMALRQDLALNSLAEGDQWRSAEELVVEDAYVYIAVEHLFHFKKIDICVDLIEFADMESIIRYHTMLDGETLIFVGNTMIKNVAKLSNPLTASLYVWALINRGEMEIHFVVTMELWLVDIEERYGEALESKFYFHIPGVDCILVMFKTEEKIEMTLIPRMNVPDEATIVNLDDLNPQERLVPLIEDLF